METEKMATMPNEHKNSNSDGDDNNDDDRDDNNDDDDDDDDDTCHSFFLMGRLCQKTLLIVSCHPHISFQDVSCRFDPYLALTSFFFPGSF